jgi:hypothetical protein
MGSAAALFGVHAEACERGVPADEVLGERRAARTRRELIAGGAAIGAGALIAASPAATLARTLTRTAPRVAVVGAGLAGLRCAHMLWTAHPGRPIATTVFEANPERPGGRCWTLRGYFADGLNTEHGGAFLNGNQSAIRRLVSRLGLTQGIVNGGDLLSGQEVYLIDGAPTATERRARTGKRSVTGCSERRCASSKARAGRRGSCASDRRRATARSPARRRSTCCSRESTPRS